MITKEDIKQIEILLNKKKIIQYELLQVSFDIACIKFQLENKRQYIAKFFVKKNAFNAIKSETENLKYLSKKFNFFPKIIKSNKNYLIMEYLENDKDKPSSTNLDFLEAVIQMHSISHTQYGFDFDTQIGAIQQVNDFKNSWVDFYTNNRLNDIFEIANKKEHLGKSNNIKILSIMKNMFDFIPDRPKPLLLHGDLWEGNILFNKKKFVGFIDPGSFFGHSEMEVAYLRWFNPTFIDSEFLKKYNDKIALEKNYLSYEPVYQLYFALCNVALWNKSYIKEVSYLLKKLKI